MTLVLRKSSADGTGGLVASLGDCRQEGDSGGDGSHSLDRLGEQGALKFIRYQSRILKHEIKTHTVVLGVGAREALALAEATTSSK